MSPSIFLLVLIAAGCHAAWNFAVRRVSGNLVVLWLAVWAGCLLLSPVALAIVWQGDAGTGATSGLGIGCMLATGVVHAVYFALLARTYEQGEISSVYPVARGSGVGLTAILGGLLLREEISALGAAGIGLIVAGILVLSSPAFKRGSSVRGLAHALGVGTSIGAYSLIDKVGVGQVHPILYLWSMFLISGLALGPFVRHRHGGPILPVAREHLYSILVIGVGSPGTYLMILFALTTGPVSYIVAVREFAVVVGALLGFVFLGERLTFSKAVGIVAITLGLGCIKAG